MARHVVKGVFPYSEGIIIRMSGKEKLHWTELNSQGRLYSRQLQKEKEIELNFFETKSGRTFMHWMS